MSPLRPQPLAAVLGLAACFVDSNHTPPGGPAAAESSGEPALTTTGTATTMTTTTTTTTTSATTGPDPDSTTTTTTTGGPASTTTSATAAESSSSTDECMQTLWYLDADGDMYAGPTSIPGCGPPPPGYADAPTDCDDGNAEIHPDAAEACDGVDNDCDGGTDEWPAAMADAYNGCSAVEHGGHVYHLCEGPLSWQDARVDCQALLADLAIVGDLAENTFVGGMIPVFTSRVWIGLDDLANEGAFTWVDGSPLTYDNWNFGEPNDSDTNTPGSADCAAMLGPSDPLFGRWRDQVCATPRPFFCETSD